MAGRARSVSLPYCGAIRERIDAAAPGGVDASIDLFGPEHLDLAVHLAVRPNRIEMTVAIDQALTLGAKTASSLNASTPDIVAELADSVAKGAIEVPIAATYPLGRVAEAFLQLERRHPRGKIVLTFDGESRTT